MALKKMMNNELRKKREIRFIPGFFRFLPIMKIIVILILTCLLFLTGCKQSNKVREEEFGTHSEAINYVRYSGYFNKDYVDTSKSSWMKGAEYYYLENSNSGYAIFNLNGKEYIHKGLPYSVWIGFKNADSFGSYYSKYIKGQYTLNLKRK